MEPLSEFIAGSCRTAMMEVGYPPRVSPIYQSDNDFPSIVYQQLSNIIIESLDGHASVGRRFQIDIRTLVYSHLEVLDEAVLMAMRSRGSKRIQNIDTASDLVEDDIFEERIYRRLRAMVLE